MNKKIAKILDSLNMKYISATKMHENISRDKWLRSKPGREAVIEASNALSQCGIKTPLVEGATSTNTKLVLESDFFKTRVLKEWEEIDAVDVVDETELEKMVEQEDDPNHKNESEDEKDKTDESEDGKDKTDENDDDDEKVDESIFYNRIKTSVLAAKRRMYESDSEDDDSKKDESEDLTSDEIEDALVEFYQKASSGVLKEEMEKDKADESEDEKDKTDESEDDEKLDEATKLARYFIKKNFNIKESTGYVTKAKIDESVARRAKAKITSALSGARVGIVEALDKALTSNKLYEGVEESQQTALKEAMLGTIGDILIESEVKMARIAIQEAEEYVKDVIIPEMEKQIEEEVIPAIKQEAEETVGTYVELAAKDFQNENLEKIEEAILHTKAVNILQKIVKLVEGELPLDLKKDESQVVDDLKEENEELREELDKSIDESVKLKAQLFEARYIAKIYECIPSEATETDKEKIVERCKRALKESDSEEDAEKKIEECVKKVMKESDSEEDKKDESVEHNPKIEKTDVNESVVKKFNLQGWV